MMTKGRKGDFRRSTLRRSGLNCRSPPFLEHSFFLQTHSPTPLLFLDLSVLFLCRHVDHTINDNGVRLHIARFPRFSQLNHPLPVRWSFLLFWSVSSVLMFLHQWRVLSRDLWQSFLRSKVLWSESVSPFMVRLPILLLRIGFRENRLWWNLTASECSRLLLGGFFNIILFNGTILLLFFLLRKLVYRI